MASTSNNQLSSTTAPKQAKHVPHDLASEALPKNDARIDTVSSVADTYEFYLKKAGQFHLLTAEQEVNLAREYINGSEQARAQLINSNLRLVINIAKKFQNRGLELSDLIQEGNIGLSNAVEKFDPNLGFRFSTYASWWIRQSISRAAGNKGKSIRLPTHAIALLNKVNKRARDLKNDTGVEPSVESLAKEFGVTAAKLTALLIMQEEVRSLDEPIGAKGSTLRELIPDNRDPGFHAFDLRLADQEFVDQILSSLPSRQQKVLRLRFGLDDGVCRSHEECGVEMGLTRQRVRQLEFEAMKKLRGNAALRSKFDSEY